MKTEVYNHFKSIFDTLDATTNNLSLDETQKIIDHFGIGKLENQILSRSLHELDFMVNLHLIQTHNGFYLLTELPLNIEDIDETQQKIDLKFNLINSVYVYPETKKIHFAHVKDLYYSVRKIN